MPVIMRENSWPKDQRLRRWLLIVILTVCVTGAASFAGPRKNRSVIVISLDGFPAYALDDPRLPIPTIRKLAHDGVIATSMRPVNPTVTWPNHTAIVTGVNASEHHVLFNGLLVRQDAAVPTVEPWRDKEQLVHAPTIYDVAYQEGLTTAQVDWVAIYGAKTITWQFPELPDLNGEIERELINAGFVTSDQLRKFEDSSQAWQDEIWTAATVDIIEKHKPNLLLFHLLTLDDINHTYGPMTPASFTAMAFLDAKVKQVVDAVKRSHRLKRTTFIILSDHGFRGYEYKIRPNELLKERGIVKGQDGQSKSDVWVMPEGGSAGVYILNRNRTSELLPELRKIFSTAEGVARIYDPNEFAALGYPLPSATDQAPDLVLAAATDYMFSGESEGPYVEFARGGTHGYINTDPQMQAIFIASGAGIQKGIRIGSISNLDVAPTIAELLGFSMKSASGRPIPGLPSEGE